MLSQNTKDIFNQIHRLTNLIEIFREKDTELSLQAIQILFLVADAEMKAQEIKDEGERNETYMSVIKISKILNLTTASASRNVTILSDEKMMRGKKPPLLLIQNLNHPTRSVSKILKLTQKGRNVLDNIFDVLFDRDYRPYDLNVRQSLAVDKRKGIDPATGKPAVSVKQRLDQSQRKLREAEAMLAEKERELALLKTGTILTKEKKDNLQKILNKLDHIKKEFNIPDDELTIEKDIIQEEPGFGKEKVEALKIEDKGGTRFGTFTYTLDPKNPNWPLFKTWIATRKRPTHSVTTVATGVNIKDALDDLKKQKTTSIMGKQKLERGAS